MRTEKIPGTVADFELLYAAARTLSSATAGQAAHEPRIRYASQIFTIICATCDSVLRVHPESIFYKSDGGEVWNPSAVAVLARTLMEGVANLHYFAVEDIGQAERSFRFALADYHCEKERMKMIESLRMARTPSRDTNSRESALTDYLDSQYVQLIRTVDRLRMALEQNEFFLTQPERRRKDWLDGKYGFSTTRQMRAERAGLARSVYEADYKYQSSYIHSAPFALSQIVCFRADDRSARERLIDGPMRCCAGYLSLGIHYFVSLFPAVAHLLPTEASQLMEVCVGYATGIVADEPGCS